MRALFAVLLVLLAGCASSTRSIALRDAIPADTGDFLDAAAFGPGEGRTAPVTFIRETGHVGSKMETMLVIDGHHALMLRPGKMAELHLTPGRHVFGVGYHKRPDTWPLLQQEFEVGQGQDVFILRLNVGHEAELVQGDGKGPATQAEPPEGSRRASAFHLPDCVRTGSPLELPARRSQIFYTGKGFCFGRSKPVARESAAATWADLGNLLEYVEPELVGDAVDQAIESRTLGNWAKGAVGRHMDECRRYVFTESGIWIDVKHVISTASNPVTAVPGASRVASWAVEVAQVFVAPMSAFLQEDTVSNHMGANAALRSIWSLGRAGTRGEIVQRELDRMGPMSFERALKYFGIAVLEEDLAKVAAEQRAAACYSPLISTHNQAGISIRY